MSANIRGKSALRPHGVASFGCKTCRGLAHFTAIFKSEASM